MVQHVIDVHALILAAILRMTISFNIHVLLIDERIVLVIAIIRYPLIF